MAKKAVSVTLDEANVLWLKSRARISGGNVSDTLDQLITKARGGRAQLGPFPSVVGTVDLSDDPDLTKADAAVREWFDEWLAKQPMIVAEGPLSKTKIVRKRRKRA